jgi:hypothetical protein
MRLETYGMHHEIKNGSLRRLYIWYATMVYLEEVTEISVDDSRTLAISRLSVEGLRIIKH